jgi:hypothetical protein
VPVSAPASLPVPAAALRLGLRLRLCLSLPASYLSVCHSVCLLSEVTLIVIIRLFAVIGSRN